jgi:hypothetical protein
MAARYWVNGGSGFWNNTNNWSATSGGPSGASVPVSADDVFFNNLGNSNCTVNASNTCRSITCSGYTSTLSVTFGNLFVTNSIEFSLGMSFGGNNAIVLQGGSLRTNGVTLGNFQFSSSGTITLLDDCTVSTLTINPITSMTLNGFAINAIGNITFSAANQAIPTSGTTVFNINGTGNQTITTNNGTLGLVVNINKASGTLTIPNFNVGFGCVLNYIAGTVVHTGALQVLGNITLNTSGISWNGLTLANTTTHNVTFTSTFTLTGTLLFNNTIVSTTNFIGAGFFTTCGSIAYNSSNITTVNLVNDLTTTNFSTTNTGSAKNLNGGSIFINGNITIGAQVQGNGKLVFSGTGTWSGVSLISMNVDINTVGTITLSGTSVTYGLNNPIFNYISGTIVQGSTNFVMEVARYNMSGVTWQNLRTGTSGTIVTMLADINCVNFTPNSACTINGAFNLNVNGNFSPPQTVSGTGTIRMVGTGTWLGGGAVNCNLVFNTAGTITIGSIVNFGASSGVATMTYTAGTILTAGSTLTLRTSSVNTGTLQWNNVIITTTPTITLLSNLLVYGILTINNSNTTLNTSNGSKICCFDGFTLGNINILGTSSIELVGNGTVTGTQTSGLFQIPLIINTLGTITLSGSLHLDNTTLTHTQGTVNPSTSTVLATGTINSNNTGLNFNILTFDGNINNIGTNGWTTNQLVCSTGTHTYKVGNTYITINLLQLLGTAIAPIVMNSSTPSSRANFVLNYGGTQTVGYVNATDIDSSLGQTIWDWAGVLNNTVNWNILTANVKEAYTFIN